MFDTLMQLMSDVVAEALALVNKSVRNPRKIDGELIVLWSRVLLEHGLEPSDVEPATVRLLGEEPFFPAPADLVRCAQPSIAARKHRRALEASATHRRALRSPEHERREREACLEVRRELIAKGGPFAEVVSKALEGI